MGEKLSEYATYSVSLVSQGKHRFYSLTVPSEILAKTCTVDTRAENPMEGFQRKLDVRRAEEIARYIDEGLGTIPTSIVLSAQESAELKYVNSRRSITFKKTPNSFLILDGQHRVFGFAKATTNLRVPVVIYNKLTRAEECRLFIDINTKQRPVPNELLLDIKKLAETETGDESLLREVFDRFTDETDSPLLGKMSPASRAQGKLSRVTFYAAIRSVWGTFAASASGDAYAILSAYLRAWMEYLKTLDCEALVTNPILFKAIILLFPDVAQRVSDRYGTDFSAQNFRYALDPVFKKITAKSLKNPGQSHIVLAEEFRKKLRQQFTIAGV
jgi:DGQHR domain-containing protein